MEQQNKLDTWAATGHLCQAQFVQDLENETSTAPTTLSSR